MCDCNFKDRGMYHFKNLPAVHSMSMMSGMGSVNGVEKKTGTTPRRGGKTVDVQGSLPAKTVITVPKLYATADPQVMKKLFSLTVQFNPYCSGNTLDWCLIPSYPLI